MSDPFTRSAPAPWEPPVDGETPAEARRRLGRNRAVRAERDRFLSEPCLECGMSRSNVVHETDPATAPEGPEYYADMDDLHEFQGVPPEPET